jgi:hypothetical protein
LQYSETAASQAVATDEGEINRAEVPQSAEVCEHFTPDVVIDVVRRAADVVPEMDVRNVEN